MNSIMYCPTCNKDNKVRFEARKETYKVHGRKITITIDLPICEECKNSMSTTEIDQKAIEAIRLAYDKAEEK